MCAIFTQRKVYTHKYLDLLGRDNVAELDAKCSVGE
jgi:hypothetical protein